MRALWTRYSGSVGWPALTPCRTLARALYDAYRNSSVGVTVAALLTQNKEMGPMTWYLWVAAFIVGLLIEIYEVGPSIFTGDMVAQMTRLLTAGLIWGIIIAIPLQTIWNFIQRRRRKDNLTDL